MSEFKMRADQKVVLSLLAGEINYLLGVLGELPLKLAGGIDAKIRQQLAEQASEGVQSTGNKDWSKQTLLGKNGRGNVKGRNAKPQPRATS